LNEKSSGSRSRKQRLTAVGTRCAGHVTPLYPQKLALTSPTGGGRSVGIVRVRTKATEFSLVLVIFHFEFEVGALQKEFPSEILSPYSVLYRWTGLVRNVLILCGGLMHNPREYVSHGLHVSSATYLRNVLCLINVKDSLFFNWNR